LHETTAMGAVARIGTVHHSCSYFNLLPTRHGGYWGRDCVLLYSFVCGLAMAAKTKGDKPEKFKLGHYRYSRGHFREMNFAARFYRITNMRMMMRFGIAFSLLGLSGCQYYEISDPTSGKGYITDNWHMDDHRAWGGGVTFQDLHDGDQITLQSSDIKAVSQERAQIDIQGGVPRDDSVSPP
jgi:hypothetical protein